MAPAASPATLTDEQMLERLVSLDAERRAEEKAGNVRWLRPDYQIPRLGSDEEKARWQDPSHRPATDVDICPAQVDPKVYPVGATWWRMIFIRSAERSSPGRAETRAFRARGARSRGQCAPRDRARPSPLWRGTALNTPGSNRVPRFALTSVSGLGSTVIRQEDQFRLVALGHYRHRSN